MTDDFALEQQTEYLQGIVETVTYQNEDTRFGVITINAQGDMTVCVGELAHVRPGEEIELWGRYMNHPSYGLQFKADTYRTALPSNAAAIYSYLSSGAIAGIGPVTARRIVDQFGDESLDVLRHHPEQLEHVKGISPRKARDIAKVAHESFSLSSAITMLSKWGIGADVAVRAHGLWGDSAESVIEQNPYVLCRDEVGVSFEVADHISAQMGNDVLFGERLFAGISHVLAHNLHNGHTCIEQSKLVSTAAEKLLRVGTGDIEDALQSYIDNFRLRAYDYAGKRYIYLPALFEAERRISERLQFIAQALPDNGESYDDEITKAADEFGLQFLSRQHDAISTALRCGLSVITGGPGTGKTTVLKAIIRILEREGLVALVAAPTGRAAKRVEELCGGQAKTIHRLLEATYGGEGTTVFMRNERNPLDCDVVIVDEMSMVDVPLFDALLKAMPMSARLILVGDSDQLPSVGPGNVLLDVIESGVAQTVELKEIFRQAQESLIVTNAHRVVEGCMPDIERKGGDFAYVETGDTDFMRDYIVDLIKTRLPVRFGFSDDDVQIIAPTKNGECGVLALNALVRDAVNPPAPDKPEATVNGVTFRQGDRVMQIRNDYNQPFTRDDGELVAGVYNGDIGRVERVDRATGTLYLRFDNRVGEYGYESMAHVQHAYAITVHKSQGSEFPAVIMPLMNMRSRLYYRNLLYTGLTRAQRLFILMGPRSSLTYMVENKRKFARYTNLRPMLCDEGEVAQ